MTKPFQPQALADAGAAAAGRRRGVRARERLSSNASSTTTSRSAKSTRRRAARPAAARGVGRPAAARPAVTEELFRSFHSLKGLAGMVEHRESELLAHEMESYLRAVREGDVALTTHGVEALIEARATLEDTHRARAATASRRSTSPRRSSAARAGRRRRRRRAAARRRRARRRCRRRGNASSRRRRRLIARGVNVDLVRARLRDDRRDRQRRAARRPSRAWRSGSCSPAASTRRRWRAGGRRHGLHARSTTPRRRRPSRQSRRAAAARPLLSSGHYVRVDLARLDELMRMIGDLVILRARLADALAASRRTCPPAEWRADPGERRRHRAPAARACAKA